MGFYETKNVCLGFLVKRKTLFNVMSLYKSELKPSKRKSKEKPTYFIKSPI